MSKQRNFEQLPCGQRSEEYAGWNVGFAKLACIFLVFFAATAISSPAQTFTQLAAFSGIDGESPSGPLVQGLDGNFYGSTSAGGSLGVGTLFKVTPTGTLTLLHTLDWYTDGGNSYAGLLLDTNGNFYGTMSIGGAYLEGTVIKMTPAGTVNTVYSFCAQTNCADGYQPSVALVEGTDGNFYGTTSLGGNINSGGIAYRITPAGKLTTLYDFGSLANFGDGDQPDSPLLLASDGNFYGTTYGGGASGINGYGTVFRLAPTGKLTTLHSFCVRGPICNDGQHPISGALVEGTDGAFYGTTSVGGSTSYGTIFKITRSGKLTTLHTFAGAEGEFPYAGPIQATDGNFYGLTQLGGANNYGTIYQMTPAGQVTDLYDFCAQRGCPDGSYASSALVQGTDGTFYGTTQTGGNIKDCNNRGCGTVFSFSMGLGPFVESLPMIGRVGTKVRILGNNLTGSSSITFNNIAATFTVVSDNQITTRVPIGATTGTVEVTTPSGILKSNVVFRVLP